jgi:hypothetical protein
MATFSPKVNRCSAARESAIPSQVLDISGLARHPGTTSAAGSSRVAGLFTKQNESSVAEFFPFTVPEARVDRQLLLR